MDKRKAKENYTHSVNEAMNFLNGQLELYKIEFINTGDNKYLQVMNDLNSTFKLIGNMDFEIKRLSKECHKLSK